MRSDILSEKTSEVTNCINRSAKSVVTVLHHVRAHLVHTMHLEKIYEVAHVRHALASGTSASCHGVWLHAAKLDWACGRGMQKKVYCNT